jgi:response regulator RpfG family c-di-GMP phosphodiesterase
MPEFQLYIQSPTDFRSRMKVSDVKELRADLILAVEDIHETSDGIKRLLKADGYRVALATNELDAIESAKLRRPDLILVTWTGLAGEIPAIVCRIRERAASCGPNPGGFWGRRY